MDDRVEFTLRMPSTLAAQLDATIESMQGKTFRPLSRNEIICEAISQYVAPAEEPPPPYGPLPTRGPQLGLDVRVEPKKKRVRK